MKRLTVCILTLNDQGILCFLICVAEFNVQF